MRHGKSRILIIAVLALGALVAVALVALGPEAERAPEPPALPVVRVMTAERQNEDTVVRAQGETRPRTRSQLVAQVAGRIAKVAPEFAAGGFFEAGQTLVWIDDTDYRLALEQAQAEVAQARVALEQAEAEAQVAREEWQELGRGREPNALVLRKPQLAQAKAALAAAQASASQARLALARTTVEAPYAGRVQEIQADVGQFVSAGTPLADIYATDYAEVRLPIQARDLAFLDVDVGYPETAGPGPRVVLHEAERSWEGHVVRVGGTVDPRTRLIDVYVRVEDPFNRGRDEHRAPLPMGLFVQAAIEGRTLENVFVLPRAAVRDGRVLVVENGRIAFRDVEVIRTQGDEVVVRGGIDEGDRVVVSALETPVAGMGVRTVPADEANN